eukprot:Nk52_evm10s210 gene=Nk52_evmTU10s210
MEELESFETETESIFFDEIGFAVASSTGPVVESSYSSPKELIAVSNEYGFMVTADEAHLYMSYVDAVKQSCTEAKEKQEYGRVFKRIVVPFTFEGIRFVGLSSDSFTLSVCTEKEVHLFDMRTFALGKGCNNLGESVDSCAPFHTARVADSPIVDLKWNPAVATTFAVCCEDGKVNLFEIVEKAFSKKSSLPATNTEKFGCMCWSPKGKQLVGGTIDGKLVQLDLNLNSRRVIERCPGVEDDCKVVGVCWLETYSFIVFYYSAEEEGSSCVVISGDKTKTTFQNYSDIFLCSAGENIVRFFFTTVREWNCAVVGYSNSTDTMVFGKGENGNWELWNLAENVLATAPLSKKDDEDTFPVGLAFNFTSSSRIQSKTDAEKTFPCSPVFIMYTTEGLCGLFNFINSKDTADPLPFISTSVLQLPATGGRMSCAPDNKPTGAVAANVPKEANSFSFQPKQDETPTFTSKETEKPKETPTFSFKPSETASLNSKPADAPSFNCKPTEAASQSFQLKEASSFSFKQNESPSLSTKEAAPFSFKPSGIASVGQKETPSFSFKPNEAAAAGPKEAPSFSFKPNEQAPAVPKETPSFSSKPKETTSAGSKEAPSFSFRPSEPVSVGPKETPSPAVKSNEQVSLSSGSKEQPKEISFGFNKKEEAASFSSSLSKAQTKDQSLFGIKEAPPSKAELGQQAHASVGSTPKSKQDLTKPMAEVKSQFKQIVSEDENARESKSKTIPSAVDEKSLNDAIAKEIDSEIALFEKELESVFENCRNVEFKFSPEEIKDICMSYAKVECVGKAFSSHVQEMDNRVAAAKERVMDMFAGMEASREMLKAKSDKRLTTLMKSRKLAPELLSKRQEMKKKYQILQQRVAEVNDRLDELTLLDKKQKTSGSENSVNFDTLFRTINSHYKIARRLTLDLENMRLEANALKMENISLEPVLFEKRTPRTIAKDASTLKAKLGIRSVEPKNMLSSCFENEIVRTPFRPGPKQVGTEGSGNAKVESLRDALSRRSARKVKASSPSKPASGVGKSPWSATFKSNGNQEFPAKSVDFKKKLEFGEESNSSPGLLKVSGVDKIPVPSKSPANGPVRSSMEPKSSFSRTSQMDMKEKNADEFSSSMGMTTSFSSGTTLGGKTPAPSSDALGGASLSAAATKDSKTGFSLGLTSSVSPKKSEIPPANISSSGVKDLPFTSATESAMFKSGLNSAEQ